MRLVLHDATQIKVYGPIHVIYIKGIPFLRYPNVDKQATTRLLTDVYRIEE